MAKEKRDLVKLLLPLGFIYAVSLPFGENGVIASLGALAMWSFLGYYHKWYK